MVNILNLGTSGSDNGDSSLQKVHKAKTAYLNIVEEFSALCESYVNNEPAPLAIVENSITEIIDLIRSEDDYICAMPSLPYSFVTHRITGNTSPFITVHGVNMMIYALQISNSLEVPDSRLKLIAHGALFHNIGLLNAEESLLNKERPLDKRSQKAIDDLILSFGEVLDHFNPPSKENLEVIISLIAKGEELPTMMDQLSDEIHQYAMIIHICKVYEALTHQKTYGKKFSPSEAMKHLRSQMKDYFHPEIIRLFFNELSIYPLGSYVKLSSGETAKIVEVNKKFIMRPTVLIVLDENQKLKKPMVNVNLRQKPTLYIKESLMEDDIYSEFVDAF